MQLPRQISKYRGTAGNNKTKQNHDQLRADIDDNNEVIYLGCISSKSDTNTGTGYSNLELAQLIY